MSELKFKLGNKLRDRVSGMEGITTGYITYLNGCVQWNIHPPVGKDLKPTGEQSFYYDEQQLELVDEGIAPQIEKEKTAANKEAKQTSRSTTGGAPSAPRQSL